MVARTRALAARHGVAVAAAVLRLGGARRAAAGRARSTRSSASATRSPTPPGRARRRAALAAMAGVLAPGGVLAVTSRNWERVRAAGPGLRRGRPARRARRPRRPRDPRLDARRRLGRAAPARRRRRVRRPPTGTVETHAERLTFWPFTHDGARRRPARGRTGAGGEQLRAGRRALPGHGATVRGRRTCRISSTVNVTVSARPRPRIEALPRTRPRTPRRRGSRRAPSRCPTTSAAMPSKNENERSAVADRAGRQGDRRARAGDVAADDQDRPAAVREQLVPARSNPCAFLRARLRAAQHPPARGPAEEVRDVVAGERAERGDDDDAGQVRLAGRGEHAGGDDEALAGDDREERVDRGEREQREVDPRGAHRALDPVHDGVAHRR